MLDAITPTMDYGTRVLFCVDGITTTRKIIYGLLLAVDGKMPMYAGWFGTFWSTNRERGSGDSFGGTIHAETAAEERIHGGREGGAVEPVFF